MDEPVGRVILSARTIHRRVRELAQAIQARHGTGSPLTVVVVLTGGLVFAADLIRHLTIPVKLHVVEAASYFDRTEPCAEVLLVDRIRRDVAGQDVLIVDDVADSGSTLVRVRGQVSSYGPRSLRTCVLMRKPRARAAGVRTELVGFELETDDFVVGFGLDYGGLYRNLPEVRLLDRARTTSAASPESTGKVGRRDGIEQG